MAKELKVVVVLGMHRSGTSMIAGILNILGVNMGERLLGANWSNPLGHFEDLDFLELNKEILREAGGSWDNPPSRDEILAVRDKFSSWIQALIERKKKSEVWGWKDPRTTLTIELYLPYLENPYFIVCHRDLMAIAHSLKRRNGMEIERGIELAKIYYKRIEKFFQNHPNSKRINIKYEDVLNNPENHIYKIIEFLGIKPDKSQYQKALNFVLSPEEKEKLVREMRRKWLMRLIKKGITHPWKIPEYIWKKFIHS